MFGFVRGQSERHYVFAAQIGILAFVLLRYFVICLYILFLLGIYFKNIIII